MDLVKYKMENKYRSDNKVTCQITPIKVIIGMHFCFPSGVIRTALPNMIRENREHYQVVIQAKDMAGQMGGLSGTATVNITLLDVNNSPPRFPHSKSLLLHVVHVNIFMKEKINVTALS